MSDPFRSDLEAAHQRIEHLEAEHQKRVGELEEENRRLRARFIDVQQSRPRRSSPARIVLPIAMLLFGVSLGAGMLVARKSRSVPLPGPIQLQELPTIDDGESAGVLSARPPITDTEDDIPFDRRAAANALDGVRFQECSVRGGPHGPGHVKVTFAPSGIAERVEVDPARYRHTLVGDCVADRYRGARVPPFSGVPVTVEKSFDILAE